MTEQAQQLVLQYLSRVADAAYGAVPARRRAAYLADLRTRVNRACTSVGAESPDEVRRILRGFGRPADLVARELAAETEGRVTPESTVAPVVSAVGEPGGDGPGDGIPESGEAAEERPGGAAAPANRPVREPPPWRGGPEGGRSRARSQDSASGGSRRADALVGLGAALRRNPPEVLAAGLYLVAGTIGALAGVWVIGAAIVVLSRVWSGLDKAVGVGVPIIATLVGMALWESGAAHIYIDEIIWESLAATGVVGLRIAAVCSSLFLIVRLARS
ncbi:hypothetical protein GCM10027570_02910 [Streptomonospora sediminis]